jgi:hypothetical protein
MTTKVSSHSFAASASISSQPKKEEEHKDSTVKKKENRIDDPIVAGRVKMQFGFYASY